jgi:hypothetical protein
MEGEGGPLLAEGETVLASNCAKRPRSLSGTALVDKSAKTAEIPACISPQKKIADPIFFSGRGRQASWKGVWFSTGQAHGPPRASLPADQVLYDHNTLRKWRGGASKRSREGISGRLEEKACRGLKLGVCQRGRKVCVEWIPYLPKLAYVDMPSRHNKGGSQHRQEVEGARVSTPAQVKR